jgi:alkaline phosphatase D
MSGEALPESAILWTRYRGDAARLSVYVAELRDDGTPARVAYETDLEPGEGYVRTEATELTPGARYEFAFLEGTSTEVTGRSAVGHFRAAIASDALEVITFAGTSCTSQFRDATDFHLGRAAMRGDLSFFLHTGDQLYTDFPRDAIATTLAEYRGKYAHAWARRGMRMIHAAHAGYRTWDDHEVCNDWRCVDDVASERVRAAVQAFHEHQALRDAPLHRSFRWGRTLELFVLDTRGERSPSEGQLISDAQARWLTDGLMRSPAVLKCVVSAAPVANFTSAIDAWRHPSDRWAGGAFADQRRGLLDVCEEVGGVFWLTGDLHFGCSGGVGVGGRYERVREVMMGAGGQGLGGNASISSAQKVASIRGLVDTGEWSFATEENNYVVFRADPFERTLGVAIYNASSISREPRQLHALRHAIT